MSDIEKVLAGEMSYDDLSEEDQVTVRRIWKHKMTVNISKLNYEDLEEDHA